MKPFLTAGLLFLLVAVGTGRAAPTPEAAATAVLYNANDPASKKLAQYYATRRGIPADRLVGVPCPPDEEISREQFTLTIATPLRKAFTQFGWWRVERGGAGQRVVREASVRFLAVIRGVPLKIRPDPTLPPETSPELAALPPPLASRNEASVDSELAAFFSPDRFFAGLIPNPYYRRFTPILEVPPSEAPLLVGRLDGPSDAVVRRMIDDALAAESAGLWGWAYVDERGITDGGYAAGDQWLGAAATMMRQKGIPVLEDGLPETFDAAFPVDHAAIYYGWYDANVSGPFAVEARIFEPGAIAVHLHSFSGATVRDPRAVWVAPLLARGAAATFGNVYEPYLELTLHFDVFQDRLMNGMTLAEAGYAAQRGISWMGVLLGDPLYRPYARWMTLDAPPVDNVWARYRAAVMRAGGPLAATPALAKLARAESDPMPLEGVAQAQAAAGKTADALASLRAAARLAKTRAGEFRIVWQEIEILRRSGRADEARARVAEALGEFLTSDVQAALGRAAQALQPPPPPPAPTP